MTDARPTLSSFTRLYIPPISKQPVGGEWPNGGWCQAHTAVSQDIMFSYGRGAMGNGSLRLVPGQHLTASPIVCSPDWTVEVTEKPQQHQTKNKTINLFPNVFFFFPCSGCWPERSWCSAPDTIFWFFLISRTNPFGSKLSRLSHRYSLLWPFLKSALAWLVQSSLLLRWTPRYLYEVPDSMSLPWMFTGIEGECLHLPDHKVLHQSSVFPVVLVSDEADNRSHLQIFFIQCKVFYGIVELVAIIPDLQLKSS